MMEGKFFFCFLVASALTAVVVSSNGFKEHVESPSLHCHHLPSTHQEVKSIERNDKQKTEITRENGTCYGTGINVCLLVFEVQWGQQDNTTANYSVHRHKINLQDCANYDEVSLQSMGCYQSSCVVSNLVVAKEVVQTRPKNTTIHVCCCMGPWCNGDYSQSVANLVYAPPARPTPYQSSTPPSLPFFTYVSGWSVLTYGTVLLVLLSVVMLVCIVSIKCRIVIQHRDKALERQLDQRLLAVSSQNDSEQLPSVCYEDDGGGVDMTRLTLLEAIGRGRYATVYRARVGDDTEPNSPHYVAVKVYQSANVSHFSNESDIHMVLRCGARRRLAGCDRVVEYLGGCHRDIVRPADDDDAQAFDASPVVLPSPRREYWLVTELMTAGTLQDRLKADSLPTLADFVRIAASIADALAYLHTEVKGAVDAKPALAHRDVNSRNVLMKPDGGCCLCDFGFAMALDRTRPPATSLTDEATLSEVGTTRYMSPEVLEGAVNLRDADAALKQIDVYAMALVFWEALARCDALYPQLGHVAPPYQLPFQKEVPTTVTSDQMQLAVCKKKMRPLMPPIFKHCQAITVLRVIRDLIDDCWDQDAEARISSECAKERLTEIKCPELHHERPFGSLSAPSSASELLIPYPSPSSTADFDAKNSKNAVSSGAKMSSSERLQRAASPDRRADVSVVTQGRLSSAVAATPPPASISPMLHPHQERNPCQQRNLLCFQPHETSSDSSASSSCPPAAAVGTASFVNGVPPSLRRHTTPATATVVNDTPEAHGQTNTNHYRANSRRTPPGGAPTNNTSSVKVDLYDSAALARHLQQQGGGTRGTPTTEKNQHTEAVLRGNPLTLLLEDVSQKERQRRSVQQKRSAADLLVRGGEVGGGGVVGGETSGLAKCHSEKTLWKTVTPQDDDDLRAEEAHVERAAPGDSGGVWMVGSQLAVE